MIANPATRPIRSREFNRIANTNCGFRSIVITDSV
jgi:hypothetical protein